ncbi:MAG: efflux RND transporter periplasmic adaptor subunit [Ectothiorhodospiraceae bacterium]|nr:efflux RND transporter periplasmic adaptor subunit [Ectothiorhodospiraceae bacterium]
MVVVALAGAAVAVWHFEPFGPLPFLGANASAASSGAPAAGKGAGPGDGKAAKGPRAVAVEVAEVATQPVETRLTAIGTLESNESVVLRSEIAGRVASIGFREAEPVKAGALVLEIDAAAARAELAEMEARLQLGRQNAERAQRLFAQKVGSASERDEAVAALRVAEAELNLARVRLAKTRIEAPFEGILGLRRVSVGAYVNPGDDLVTLDDIDPIKVDFRVPERALSQVRTGQRIEVRIDALPDRTFTGEVYAIAPRVDVAGRALSLRARLPNPDGQLRPGLFARVDLVVDRREAALVVPEQAIVPVAEGQAVYVVIDERARLTPVTLGQRAAARVEITDGLAAGDVVVTAGQHKIRDGAPVRIAAPPRG